MSQNKFTLNREPPLLGTNSDRWLDCCTYEPQHLRTTVLQQDLAIDVLSTAFEYGRPQMLRSDARRRGYSQQVGGYLYTVYFLLIILK